MSDGARCRAAASQPAGDAAALARWRSSAGSRSALLGAGHPVPLGGSSPPTTTASATASRGSSPASRTSTRTVAPARRLRAAAPAARRTRGSRRATGKANFTVNALRWLPGAARAGCCCRRCAATTSTTPRSTASTTATAASRAAGGCCSSTPTTSPPRARRRRPGRPDLRMGRARRDDRRSAAPRTSDWWPTRHRRGNVAAYYPETNPLIPLDHVARNIEHPVSKAIMIRLERRP